MTTGTSLTDPVARILFVCGNDEATPSALELADALQGRALINSAPNGRTAADLLRTGRFDAVLIELLSIADLTSETDEALARLVRLSADALVLALAPQLSVSAVMAVMGAGAHDYVACPLSAAALADRIGELAARLGKNLLVAPEAEPELAPAQAKAPETNASESDGPYIRLVTTANVVLPMWRQEQRIIEEAIATFSGNIALAAAALELSPSTIYRKRQAWAVSGDKRGAA